MVKGFDLFVIVVYFAFLVTLGYFMTKRVRSSEDAMVAGRKLGVLLTASGRGANLVGGATIVGGASWGFSLGITGIWFAISTALLGFAFAPLAGKIKRVADKLKFLTIGDFFEYRYNRTARMIAGLSNAIAFIGFVASQIVTTGVAMEAILDISSIKAMIISTLIVMAYTMMGGLWAVIYTDLFQLIIIFVAVPLMMLPVCLNKVGGFSHLAAVLPAKMLDIGGLGWGAIISMVIGTTLAGFVLQSGFAYSIASKDDKTATHASWVSSIIYIIPAVAAVIIGMTAFLLLPDLKNANAAATAIAKAILPAGMAGLFLAAIIAATMSTASTCSMMSTMCIIRDFYQTIVNPRADEKTLLRLTRLTVMIVITVALIVAIEFPKIIPLIIWGYTFAVGALLAAMLGGFFWRRATAAGAVASMLAGGGLHLGLAIAKVLPKPLDPIFFSLPAAALVLVVVSYLTPPPKAEVVDAFMEKEATC